MKTIKLLFSALIAFNLFIIISSDKTKIDSPPKSPQMVELNKPIPKGGEGGGLIKEEGKRLDRPDLAQEQDFRRTKDPALGYPPTERLAVVRQKILNFKAFKKGGGGIDQILTAVWEERGPNNVGGRTRAIMFDPNGFR